MTSKSDLVGAVAKRAGSTRVEAKPYVDAVFAEIGAALVAREPVRIPGFGVFDTKRTKPRTGRNPQTGDEIDIPAGTKITFKPSADLKGQL